MNNNIPVLLFMRALKWAGEIATLVLFVIIIGFHVSCAKKPIKYEQAESLKVNDEFERAVEIKAAEEPPVAPATPVKEPEKAITTETKSEPTKATKVKSETKTETKKKKTVKPEPVKVAPVVPPPPPVPVVHEPAIEGQKGFVGRRPIRDPFRVGEKVVHAVRYYRVNAGELSLEVRPFVEVNGKKNYTFATSLRSNPTFDSFYSLDDLAITHVDFETFLPSVFTLTVKETGQLREGRGIFDWQTKKATYWEKKYTKDKGHQEKKLNWDILEYSQNVFSAISYMRVFDWEVGKEVAFRVADDNENQIFRGKAIRKEVLETDIGEFNTVVIKPEIEVKGVFKPVGDIYMWLSDDERKFLLKIESKIKIGTIKTEVIRIEKGRE